MMTSISIAIIGATLLAGCAGSQSTRQFARIDANAPPLEQALAYCRIQSQGAQQGYYAAGSGAFVIGAALGNAIGNAIRADRFIDDCIVLMGWHETEAQAQE
jgi:hypothetical protein